MSRAYERRLDAKEGQPTEAAIKMWRSWGQMRR